MKLLYLDRIMLIIAIIGALDLGSFGIFRLDFIAALFGELSWLTRCIYVLIGISGIYLISNLKTTAKERSE